MKQKHNIAQILCYRYLHKFYYNVRNVFKNKYKSQLFKIRIYIAALIIRYEFGQL